MQIIAKRTLRLFWADHPQAETPLRTWHMVVDKAVWSGPADVKAMFGASVDFVGTTGSSSTSPGTSIA